jgi:hypothetical protein
VTATDSNGVKASSPTLDFVVYKDPKVTTPTAQPASEDLGQTVTFNVTAYSGSGDFTYNWSGLPAGCGGTLPSIQCTPTVTGTFVISVIATDSNGVRVESTNATFTIFPDPGVGNVTASVPSVDLTQTVTFGVTPTFGSGNYTFFWSGLPAGCSGDSRTVPCTPDATGNSTVSVNVTDTLGTTVRSGTLPFVVFADPHVSNLTSSPGSVDVGQTVTFSVTATDGSGGFHFVWSGLPAGCAGIHDIVRCVPTAGIRTSVTVTAMDSDGYSLTPGPLLFSVDTDPAVVLTADHPSLDVGQELTLTAGASAGSGGYSYVWADLPSGCGSTTSVVTCSPADPGQFAVSVTLTDSNGATVSSPSLRVSVASALSAQFSAAPNSPSARQPITFVSHVSGGTGPFSYAWAFGDGSYGVGASVNHSFADGGTYSVTLWVNDSSRESVEKVFTVAVSNAAPGSIFRGPLWGQIAVILAAVVAVGAAIVMVARPRGGNEPPAHPYDERSLPAEPPRPGGPP